MHLPALSLPAVHRYDLALCRWCGRAQSRRLLLRIFRGASTLGDGGVWFALAALLPLAYGSEALPAVGEMALAGILSLLTYKSIKGLTGRERPHRADASIIQAARELDRYSFPSGHTLHAVAFATVAIAHFGELAWPLVPLALLISASRVVLGLHYPTDVVAGAALGGAIGWSSLQLL